MSAYTNAQTSFQNYATYHRRAGGISDFKDDARRKAIEFSRLARRQDDVSLVLESMAELIRARRRYMTRVADGRTCSSIMQQGATQLAHHMIDKGFIRTTQDGVILWWEQEVGKMEELPDGTYRVVCESDGKAWPRWTYTTADNWRRCLDLFVKGQLVAAGFSLFDLSERLGRGG